MELIPKSTTYLIHDFISGLNKPCYTGFKGPDFIDIGYVWAPYIPVYDYPEVFSPRRDLLSRYATKVVNNSYYGVITV